MKFYLPKFIITALVLAVFFEWGCSKKSSSPTFYAANDSLIQYTGRIDFSNSKKPRIWAPGAYLKVRFKGNSLKFLIRNEAGKGTALNYLEIIVDHHKPRRIQLSSANDTVTAAQNLDGSKAHTAMIVKDTEGISYIEIEGLITGKLLPLKHKVSRKIQFIGNSITCGFGNDTTKTTCSKGKWYDHENAFMSYAPVTARKLNARWVLASVSGIGMIHSCCGMKIVMPQVYGHLNMRNDSIPDQFHRPQPDVVTICLGQNDGIQDSTDFAGAYVKFIERIRNHYPKAQIVCLNSPMADKKLNTVLQHYITGVVDAMHQKGDKKVTKYFFSIQNNDGCANHPSMKQDKLLASQLSAYLKKLMHW
jgi:hypothetical protein